MPLRFFSIAIAACLMMVSGCSPRGKSATGVSGAIVVEPTDPGPVTHTTFIVQQNGITVTSFTTDEFGRFTISLPPGPYTVALKDRNGAIGRYGPFSVEVAPRRMTKVVWRCDNSAALRTVPVDQ